ncbi:MAG: hypothetical protein JSS60_05580 [Verrucomicrobia bacterium]|nr:hypothetical protein [Verrucomicrobiota bacterium]
MKFTFCLLILASAVCCRAEEKALLDLEAMAQDFVLETRKIEVPGHPFAFNPAIVRWRGQLLMSFRIIPDRKQNFNTELGIVILNEEFEPISTPQLLYLRDETAIAPCRAEDICFLTLQDRLFIIYDDNEEKKISKGGFRMYVAELFNDGDHFVVGDVECLRFYEGESRDIREKSWVPFDYQGNLLLAYSLQPHKIFFPRLDGSGICDTVASTLSRIPWNYGLLRGGTQATLENGQYLSFFHSSKDMETVHSGGNKMSHYFMGAYTFSPEPPFVITAASPEPIIGKHFYNGIVYKPYWKPIRCVFPRGFISDNNFIWLAYGRDDHECWIVKLDKKGLLNSLVPVQIQDERP